MGAKRNSDVTWEKDLIHGNGVVRLGSKALQEFPVTWISRTEQPGGKTSPEELLAAAQAACYAMALSATLTREGTPPQKLNVSAECEFDSKALKVTSMVVKVNGSVPGMNESEFQQASEEAEKICPISNAIRGNIQSLLMAKLD
jgi:lipoyl-dependent peroxiredoxin